MPPVQAALAIAFHRVGGYSDNRHVRSQRFFLCPDRCGSFHAIHLRHLYIHQHGIKMRESLRFEHFKGFASVRGHRNHMPALTQKPQGQLAIDGVVFHQQ